MPRSPSTDLILCANAMNPRSWKLRASVLLDNIERNKGEGIPSLLELAREIGVSRQTLWRDKALVARWSDLKAARSQTPGSPRRRSKDQRVRALELQVEVLSRENEVLLLNFIGACHRLRAEGIDPFDIFGKAAEEPGLFKSGLLPAD